MMHEDYVTYEQAVKLKELGFDWKYGKGFQMKTYYNFLKILGQFDEEIITTEIPAPTLAQVQKWLREVKEKYLFVDMGVNSNRKYYWYITDAQGISRKVSFSPFDSYEEALSSGINKSIEILKEQSK